MRNNLIKVAVSLLLIGIVFLGFVASRSLIFHFAPYFETRQWDKLFVSVLLMIGVFFVFSIYWLLKKYRVIKFVRLIDMRVVYLLIGTFFFGVGISVLLYGFSGLVFLVFR